MRIPFETVKAELKRVMMEAGLSEEQAEICAQTHAESSCDGVYSHGVNRVPRFIRYIRKGWVNINGKPELIKASGCLENYDGNLGIGIINAKLSMNRACELAEKYGIGVVCLRNTTHWMRGGTYAWDAAKKGYMAICWTNTESAMPAWGAKTPSVGNNPFCIGIPSKKHDPLVLDMAMSQYSYGKLQVLRLKGEQLPFPGGYDTEGNITSDPGEIEKTMRMFPMGYWKGSGMAIALDIAAAVLANGKATYALDKVGKGSCGECCQIFIAINPYIFSTEEEVEEIFEGTIKQLSEVERIDPDKPVTYPGQRTVRTRKYSIENGVEVDESIWKEIQSL